MKERSEVGRNDQRIWKTGEVEEEKIYGKKDGRKGGGIGETPFLWMMPYVAAG